MRSCVCGAAFRPFARRDGGLYMTIRARPDLRHSGWRAGSGGAHINANAGTSHSARNVQPFGRDFPYFRYVGQCGLRRGGSPCRGWRGVPPPGASPSSGMFRRHGQPRPAVPGASPSSDMSNGWANGTAAGPQNNYGGRRRCHHRTLANETGQELAAERGGRVRKGKRYDKHAVLPHFPADARRTPLQPCT